MERVDLPSGEVLTPGAKIFIVAIEGETRTLSVLTPKGNIAILDPTSTTAV